MPTVLLTTKLYVPRVRPELVHRPRLVEHLEVGLHRKLTLVSAPAGFGKTTLLSTWIHQRSADEGSPDERRGSDRPSGVAWLSLDDNDNDPARFLAYLIAALQRVDQAIGGGALQLLQSGQPPPAEALLTEVINQVAPLNGQVVLVLDDYHVITASAIHSALAFLLEHLPSNMHLVIASRSDPPLSLARLRARDQLTELRQADLRFTAQEAAAFLNQVMGLDLAAPDVAALEARTEGWIAGLQMAALAMHARRTSARTPAPGPGRDVSGFVQAFTGSHRFVLDYLVEEVLEQQPPAIQEFLLKTSILERLTGPLCDAVLADDLAVTSGRERLPEATRTAFVPQHGPGSQEILDQLEAANLFIIPLDDERRWYRYHRLFADLLQKRLRQHAGPSERVVLHRRASAWCQRHGLLAGAIEHALEAGDLERAADLIEEVAERTMMRSEVLTLQRWIDRLPDPLVRSRPILCVYDAWSLLLSGQPWDRVQARLADVAHWENATDDEVHSARMAALQAWVAAFRGRMVRAGEWARRALEGLPQGDSFLRSVSLMNLGIATLSEGDLAVGRQVLEDVARSCEESGNAMIAVMVLCHLAEVRAKQAQLYEARQIYQRAVDAATDAQGVRLPVAGEALMGLAELARQWNDLEAAERYATEGIDLASQWAKVGALEGYVTLARLRQSAGDLHGADEALQVARGLAVEFDATELDDHIVALAQARLWIDQGRFDALERWVRDRGVDRDQQASVPSGEDAWIDHHLHKYEALVLVRAHLAQGHLEEALALLEPLLERLQRRGRHDLTIEALTLKAVALEAQGREVDALAALGQALAQGELGGYVRVFADAGPPVARLLPKALAHRQAGFDISPDYVRTLLDALDATPTVLHPARQPLLDPLSEREMDVLRLLATGMSNPEIADALVVAVSTVRSHLKSIYSKLDVHKRWDAVQRAQDLGLL